MSRGVLRPPGGTAPPESAPTLAGERVELRPLAEETARRYFAEFPEDLERHGAAAEAWCVHDNQHILNWALLGAAGLLDLDAQVGWLAGVLEARGLPRERLARNLELAADVADAQLGEAGAEAAAALRRSRASALRPGCP